MADNKRIVYTIEVNDKGKVKVLGLSKSFETASGAVKKLNADLITQGNIMEDNTKKNQQMIDKTGLAGATVVELGRTISDSNYGLRAMANNISQLATLMTTLLFTTGGVTNGLKALWNALMGPLGLIVAFQYFIARAEKAEIESQKFGNTLNSTTDKIYSQRVELLIYADTLRDVNASEIQREEAISAILKALPDLTEQELLSRQGLEKLNDEIEDYINNQLIRAEIDKLYAENEENFRLVREAQAISDIDNEKDRIEAMKEFLKDSGELSTVIKRNFGDFYGFLSTLSQDPQRAFNDLGTFISKLFNKTDEDIMEAFDFFTTGLNNSTESAISKIRNLIAEITGDRSLTGTKKPTVSILDFGDAGELLGRLYQDIEGELEKRDKEAKSKKRARLRRLLGLPTEEEQKNELSKFLKSEEERIDLKKKEHADDLKRIEERKNAEERLFSLMTSQVSKLASIQNQAYQGQISRLDAERDIILNNDNLTAKEKDRLLKENDKQSRDIRIKQIKFERDMFQIEAAMELAKLTMAANGVLFNIGASATQGTLDATSSIGKFLQQLGPIAGPIAFAAMIGGVIAQISSARKKAEQQIRALSGPLKGVNAGGGSSSPGVPAPAFNVVGATQTSQLAQTISQAEDKPIKAFVVASDVSTAQELERSTIEGASIG